MHFRYNTLYYLNQPVNDFSQGLVLITFIATVLFIIYTLVWYFGEKND